MTKLYNIYKEVLCELENSGIETPKVEASFIFSEIAKVESYKIISYPDMPLENEIVEKIRKIVKRRISGEPLSYIFNKKDFYGFEFYVDENVLIPRPETELIVDLVIYKALDSSSVLDLCCGSGAIAVSVKKNRLDLKVTASDISPSAIEVAEKNCDRICQKGDIEFIESDLFDNINDKYNIIVTNPPYVSNLLRGKLQTELNYEPDNAIFASDNGLDIIKKIITNAGDYLLPNGVLIIEIGHDQGNSVKDLSQKNYNCSILKDYSGLDRIAVLNPK